MALTFACVSYGCAPFPSAAKSDHCVRCGTRVLAPKPLYRDLRLEEEIVKQATRGKIDPEALISHCQTRCEALSGEYVADPRLILRGKNRKREAREEAADGINHLLFGLQEHPVEDPGEIIEVIGLFALAYETLRRLEHDD